VLTEEGYEGEELEKYGINIPHTIVIVSVTVAGMAMMKMAQDTETKTYPFSLLAVAFWVYIIKLFISLFCFSVNLSSITHLLKRHTHI
jgi:hypothetical protein